MTSDVVTDESWLTTSEASRQTGYTSDYIRQLILANDIQQGKDAVKRGNVWFLSRGAIDWLNQRRNKTGG